MLYSKHFAGAANPTLHFVGNQQDAVTVAQITQAGHKAIRRNQIAAFTLDGFN
jgi:hypothetical protein